MIRCYSRTNAEHRASKCWRTGDRNYHSRLCSHSSLKCVPTIIQLLEQLPERGVEHRSGVTLLEKQVSELGWDLTELVRQEHQRQAANQVSIGNVITSMRLLANLEWIEFFEHVNRAEQILRLDPAGVYAEMHFDSRDRYRHVIEELAKRTKNTDVQIAELAIACAHAAQSADQNDVRRSHVGYWLVDKGRSGLESQIGYRPPLHRAVQHAMLNWPNATYFSLLSLLTLLGAGGIAVLGIWPRLAADFDRPAGALLGLASQRTGTKYLQSSDYERAASPLVAAVRIQSGRAASISNDRRRAVDAE